MQITYTEVLPSEHKLNPVLPSCTELPVMGQGAVEAGWVRWEVPCPVFVLHPVPGRWGARGCLRPAGAGARQNAALSQSCCELGLKARNNTGERRR